MLCKFAGIRSILRVSRTPEITIPADLVCMLKNIVRKLEAESRGRKQRQKGVVLLKCLHSTT